MAKTKTTTTVKDTDTIEAWKKFQEAFRKTNLDTIKDTVGTTDNNIKLIDDILGRFMSPAEWAAKKKDESQKENRTGNPVLPSYNVKTPHVDVWINGIRVIKQGQTDNIAAYTNNPSADAFLPDLDVMFKDMSLDMAFGGPLGTIRGTMNLFSRDPLDFLSFLYDYTSNLESCDGLPTLSVQFGWNVASPQGDVSSNNGSTLLTPKLDFLVMNVAMADPSVEHQGSIFTLTLQDTGSAVYENSAADFGIVGDYPQNQLRILLEKALNIRLLTLDDFMGEQDEKTVKLPAYTELDPSDQGDALLLQQIAAKLQAEEKTETGSVTTGRMERFGLSLDGTVTTAKTVDVGYAAITHLSDGTLWEIIGQSLTIFGIDSATNSKLEASDANVKSWMEEMKSAGEYQLYMNDWNKQNYGEGAAAGRNKNTLWEVYIEYNSASGSTPENYIVKPARNLFYAVKSLYDYLDAKDETKMYTKWVLQRSANAALAVNGRFELAKMASLNADVQRLFGKEKADAPTDKTQTYKEVIGKYSKAKIDAAVTQVYKENSASFTKTFFLNGQHPALRINSGSLKDIIESLVSKIQCRWYPVSNSQMSKEISSSNQSNAYEAYKRFKSAVDNGDPEDKVKELQKQYDEAKSRKAYGCRLVHIPNVPTSIISKYSEGLIDKQNMTAGAFVLIPNVNPLHITDDEVPLIYGPGGSTYPYLYGGAQNVKQVLLDKSNKLPKFYGEVIDAKVNFNSMTALIAGNFNEEAMIAEAGSRLSRVTSLPAKLSASRSKDQVTKDRQDKKKRFLEELKKHPLYDKTPEQLKEIVAADLEAKFAEERKKSRPLLQFATNYPGNRTVYLADPVDTPVSDRTYTNPRRAKDAATDFLAQRLGNLLYSATSISMAVMGDPFLVRQGIGAFELLHYFIDRKGTGLRYNYLLSGVYLVQSINHTISAGQYITNIKAFKIPPVKNSFSGTVDTWRRDASKKDATGKKLNPEAATAIDELMNSSIDLETSNIDITAAKPTTAARIVKGTISNTEVGNPSILNDINKFYFGIKNN